MKVFISCVSNEFRTLRADLRQRLTSDLDEVKVQEDFGCQVFLADAHRPAGPC